MRDKKSIPELVRRSRARDESEVDAPRTPFGIERLDPGLIRVHTEFMVDSPLVIQLKDLRWSFEWTVVPGPDMVQ